MKKSYFIKINNLVQLLTMLFLLAIVLSLLLKGTFDAWIKIDKASELLTESLSFTLYYSENMTIFNITIPNIFVLLILKEVDKNICKALLSSLRLIWRIKK
ncbi:hypothetical protein [Listeria fleischmannii]|uniref:Uncharacterized protein n=1 Tax=Listeria fleischmannii TaxID=1069827 RepID=A0A841YAP6_9LIST|nr:hypothetical protein [Listeria fleischmannii]EIA20726.1 hypothetical protein KKC_05357 [Listeria fleischmannii subsp. coloradonensis]MBC1397331.1 hypothetical protein [Listeria fleischmannii]MBC1425700.1 hypothetical protein [Listeria fleischmannii]STY35362.1 Uncharacterised protein [Listeria fleischmannii subsp. coloradonensis]